MRKDRTYQVEIPLLLTLDPYQDALISLRQPLLHDCLAAGLDDMVSCEQRSLVADSESVIGGSQEE